MDGMKQSVRTGLAQSSEPSVPLNACSLPSTPHATTSLPGFPSKLPAAICLVGFTTVAFAAFGTVHLSTKAPPTIEMACSWPALP